jgi:catechol 2,3-dioxygenase-like lactoylglutathione lyase family enzyme
MIEGISHITFIVNDLDKATHFFQSIFDAEVVYDSGENTHSLSKEIFFLINGIWIAIMEGNSLKEKTYNHVAFKVEPTDFHKYVERVKKIGVEIKKPRNRVKGEAASLYFYDYDNHLFEIHTGNLIDRLKKYKESG